MCGRYGLWVQPDDLEQRFDAELTFEYEPRYNIAPEGPGIAAVRNKAADEIDRLRWGLLPSWVDDADEFPDLINARAESVAEKPSFRDAFEQRRCLLPASSFYEWTDRRGRSVPYCIGPTDQDVFAMAGLWETWSSNGEIVRTAAIITTEANDAVADIHHRMPVILDPDEETRWLEAEPTEALDSLLRPYPAERMDAYEVSPAVNDATNDSPGLIDPVGGEQSGLGEFS
ncbi:MAG: SOS response-associated peptidase [Halobacteriales archaeon]